MSNGRDAGKDGQGTLKLSGRLSLIADCVRLCAEGYQTPPRMADIGCDHALVPVSLLVTESVSFACACDIKEGPLQAAKENAKRFGLIECENEWYRVWEAA